MIILVTVLASILKFCLSNLCTGSCANGQYRKSCEEGCVDCPTGFYCPENSTAAFPCLEGTENPRVGSNRISDCVECEPGAYSTNKGSSSCFTCPKGYMCIGSFYSPIRCHAGYYSLSGTSECTPCEIGYYCPGYSEVLPCESGFFSNHVGAVECYKCPDGTYSMEGQSNCTECEPGYMCQDGEKTICEEGTYSVDYDCLQCPKGTYSSQGSDFCSECDNGNFCLNGKLSPQKCPKGTYQKPGMIKCEMCNVGTYTTSVGSTECISCPIGSMCPEPFVDPILCASGSFSEYEGEDGKTYCVPCGVGSECAKTEYPSICQKGEYSVSGTDSCETCEQGTYSSEGASFCRSCPAGYKCETPSDLPISCTGEGYFSNHNSTSCQVCPEGTYSSDDHTTCQDCLPGYYCKDVSLGPLPCQLGTYSLGGASKCEDCPRGYKCPNPAVFPVYCVRGYSPINSTVCILCPFGYECPTPDIDPVECGDGLVSMLGEDECISCGIDMSCSDSESQMCLPGYYKQYSSGSCEKCPAGYRCISGMSPIECPTGYYSREGESECKICEAGKYCKTPSNEPVECEKGFYSSGMQITCSECPEGLYCPDIYYNSIVPCKDGTYSAAGSFECIDCQEGKECNSTILGSFQDCTAGYYSLGNELKCNKCPAGFYCQNNVSTPVLCEEGYFSSSGQVECSVCRAGFNCPSGTRSYESQCSYGTYSNEGSISCTICPPGYFCDGINVTECPEGFFCVTEHARPVPCPPGTFSTGTGNSKCERCEEGYFCSLGSISSNSTCVTGHYCPSGTTYATQFPCPAGTWSNSPGNRNISQCDPCPEGKYCDEGTTFPKNCPFGHYCPEGTNHPLDFPCPPGSYSSKYSIVNESECLECSRGKYCPVGSTKEIDCPMGTYNNETGVRDVRECLPCIEGYYCPTKGMKTGNVFVCPRGYFCPSQSINPYTFPCPEGTYNDIEGLASLNECKVCIEGFACLEGTGEINADGNEDLRMFQGMLPCKPGFYCPGAILGENTTIFEYSGLKTHHPTQYACPGGTYNPNMQAPSINYCLECPGGRYCREASPSVSGKCTMGYFCPPGSSTNVSQPCPAGTFSSKEDNSDITDCNDCPEGSFCIEGSIVPELCPGGTYANIGKTESRGPNANEGQGECVVCTEGSYCPEGSVTPIDCGVGLVSSSGSEECDVCPAGYFCPKNNTSYGEIVASYNCPAGMYCNNGTINPEEQCPKGYYCPSLTDFPIKCPQGTYNNKMGESDCEPCPPGYYCLEGTIQPTGQCLPGYYCEEGSHGPTTKYCPPGTFTDSHGSGFVSNCSACTEGFYCPIATANPLRCKEGFYCPEGTDLPIPCPVGSFGKGNNLVSVDECTKCTAGFFCDTLGATNPTGPCDPGYYCILGSNTSRPTNGVTGNLCPKGGFCELGSIIPISCNPGTFNNVTGASSEDDCESCTPGYYCAGSNKASPTGKCNAGYYCSGGASTPTQYETPRGYYSVEGSESPIICEDGYFNDEPRQNTCVDCKAGFYCPNKGMMSQIVCPEAHYCELNTITPQPCPKGSYSHLVGLSEQTECLDCLPGKYCKSDGIVEPSGSCGAGYYCTGVATESNPIDKTYGDECPTGYFCPNGTATPQPCPPGTYGDIPGTMSVGECNPCKNGYFCPDSGMVESDLVDEFKCQEGFFCNGSATVPTQNKCKIGYMCEFGDDSMHKCDVGYYNTHEAASNCEMCPEGYYCNGTFNKELNGHIFDCPAGYYCPLGSENALPCPKGSFSDIGGFSEMSQCSLCTGGMYCSKEGLTAPNGFCEEGYYCNKGALDSVGNLIAELPGGVSGICQPGNYCPEGTSRVNGIPCPQGTFLSTSFGKKVEDCEECTPGSYCDRSGLTDVSGPCSAGYYCTLSSITPTPFSDSFGDICPTGAFCLEGSKEPTGCEKGKYQSVVGKDDCDVCPGGYICYGNTSVPEDCKEGYFCTPGTYEYTSSLKCPYGSYSDVVGLYNITQCKTCSAGRFCSEMGLTEPNGVCLEGFYCRFGALDEVGQSGVLGGDGTNCPVGHYCTNGSSYPSACPLGTYNPDEYSTSELDCHLCDPGMFCDSVGRSGPTGNCSKGYYCTEGAVVSKPIDGITGDICPQGRFCVVGSSEPKNCTEGAFGDVEGLSECSPCEKGYYCVENIFEMIECPMGSYCLEGSGYVDILPCPEGTFSNETGLFKEKQCKLCTPGKVCSQEGLVEPNEICEAGYYCQLGSKWKNGTLGKMGGVEGGLCPTASHCPTGSSHPLVCPKGYFSSEEGKTNITDCVICTEGFFCSNYGQSDVSGSCSPGYYCPEGQIIPNSPENVCPEGHFCKEESSLPLVCEDGQFQPFVARNYCIPCIPGHYCQSGEIIPCPAFSFCEEGSENPAYCLPGTYSDDMYLKRHDECLPCPTGVYCFEGQIVANCSSGHICYSGNEISTPDNNLPKGDLCPVGFYCLEGAIKPTPCTNNTFGKDRGAKNSSWCGPCEAGYFCIEGESVAEPCPVGHYCPEGKRPTECPLGSFNPNLYVKSVDECIDCLEGYYCDEVGLVTLERKECPPGYFCSENSTSPSLCPNGTYNELSLGKSIDSCKLCPGGYFCNHESTKPVECSEGYFCPNGSVGETVCLGRGYCPARSILPTICPESFYCPRGSPSPIFCEDAHYCPGNTSEPIKCTLGYKHVDSSFRDSLTSSCVQCSPGTYGVESRQECENCWEGYYCSEFGIQTPTPQNAEEGGGKCRKGYMCPESSISEIPCPPGYYQENEGSSNCSACEEGSYSNLPGQSECKMCGITSVSNEDNTGCLCIGNFRTYQHRSKECICQSGYIFYDGFSFSNNDSHTDCQPIIYQRCYSTEKRTLNGECVTSSDENECDDFCVEGSETGKITSELGICECDDLINENEICDQECRENQDTLTIDKFSGKTSYGGTTLNCSLGGDYECITESCNFSPIIMTENGFYGVYNPPEDYIQTICSNKNVNTSRRMVEQNNLLGMYQPLVCLNFGDGIVFNVSPESYPVYLKDTLVNTNPKFDFTQFKELSRSMENGEDINVFPFLFTESGVYIFRDSSSESRYIIIRVMNEDETCPKSSTFLPLTVSNIVSLGIRKQENLLLVPDMYLVIILLIVLCVFIAAMIIIIHRFRKSRWGLTRKIKRTFYGVLDQDKVRTKGGEYKPKELLWSSKAIPKIQDRKSKKKSKIEIEDENVQIIEVERPDEEMSQTEELIKIPPEETSEVSEDGKIDEKELEKLLEEFGTEKLKEKIAKFTSTIEFNFRTHRKGHIHRYQDILDDTYQIKQYLGKMQQKSITSHSLEMDMKKMIEGIVEEIEKKVDVLQENYDLDNM